MARNELDTHAHTCCAGANWALIELTNQVCEVTPFLDSYEPITEVPLARCGTVWSYPTSTQDYPLVGDQSFDLANNYKTHSKTQIKFVSIGSTSTRTPLTYLPHLALQVTTGWAGPSPEPPV
jgi:hypothetical protein